MTTTTEVRSRGVLRGVLRGSAGIAVAMGVMNLGTYGFQMAAARLLGPAEYGGVAGLMALLMVVGVVQFGLQATAARRIASTPGQVAQIEQVVLRVTYRAAFVLGLVMLAASPVVYVVLRLDSIVPALLLAISAVPLTIMGGQAGILQGERRWLPLALLYLGLGVPRLVFGALCMAISPTETSAMVGVTVGLMVPAAVGWWALRRSARAPGETSDDHAARRVLRETTKSSIALLAFFVLSSIDIVIARNALDEHEAGLYAGGLILTKAVLFLPQFVVIVAFPSMSTVEERRRALLSSLTLVAIAGAFCTLAATLLSDVAMVFIGGDEYSDVQGRLWIFAVLGTLLSMLQLLVYSVLARQGTKSTYLVWASVLILVVGGLVVGSLGGLVMLVTAIDAVLLLALLGLSLYRMRPART